MAPVFNIAVLIYPNADMLDFCGPLEVFTNSAALDTEWAVTTTTFSGQVSVKTSNNALTIAPNASIEEVDSKLETYDLVIVPGAHPEHVKDFNASEDGKKVLRLLNRFAGLTPRKETGQRIVQSVCTGALVLAASGILAGKTITTHHLSYDDLKTISNEAAGGDAQVNVVRKRWVDAGLTDAGVRIVNAGGVTSGIDTSLYVVEMLAGKEQAEWTASMIEYERKENKGWSD